MYEFGENSFHVRSTLKNVRTFLRIYQLKTTPQCPSRFLLTRRTSLNNNDFDASSFFGTFLDGDSQKLITVLIFLKNETKIPAELSTTFLQLMPQLAFFLVVQKYLTVQFCVWFHETQNLTKLGFLNESSS